MAHGPENPRSDTDVEILVLVSFNFQPIDRFSESERYTRAMQWKSKYNSVCLLRFFIAARQRVL